MVGAILQFFCTWTDFPHYHMLCSVSTMSTCFQAPSHVYTCSAFPALLYVSARLLTSGHLILEIPEIPNSAYHHLNADVLSEFFILFNCATTHPIIDVKQTNQEQKLGTIVESLFFYILYYSWHPINHRSTLILYYCKFIFSTLCLSTASWFKLTAVLIGTCVIGFYLVSLDSVSFLSIPLPQCSLEDVVKPKPEHAVLFFSIYDTLMFSYCQKNKF